MRDPRGRGIAPARRRRDRRIQPVVVVALLLGAVIALGYLDRHRYDAKVPLGSWYGTLAPPAGPRAEVLLVVSRKELAPGDTYMGKSRGVDFRGSAELCEGGRVRRHFRVSGFTDQDGPGFTLYLTADRASAGEVRFSDDGLRGMRHGDTMQVSGQVQTVASPGRPVPAADGSTSFTLARSGAPRSVAVCAARRAHASWRRRGRSAQRIARAVPSPRRRYRFLDGDRPGDENHRRRALAHV